MPDLQELLTEALDTLAKIGDPVALEQAKARYLGKSGVLSEQLKQLGKLPPAQRPMVGSRINQTKQAVEQAIAARREAIAALELESRLAQEALDVTLPGRGMEQGGLHPLTRTMQRIEMLYHSIGFEIATGPEIETDFYNFTALNFPESHPARAMHDTFFLEGGQLLRTHTSPVQIRHMQTYQPPVKIITAGRVYRVEADATHSPMFHQLEGLWVDENICFVDLKGVIVDFLRRFFERDELRVRFRPSFFPFTEPSAEIDMGCVFCDGSGCRVCGHTGWLEIAGAGMVHPNVFANVAIDSERYTGFAFGMGLDRLAMLRYGVNDLRLFFENDLRFLRQFS